LPTGAPTLVSLSSLLSIVLQLLIGWLPSIV